MARKKKKDDPPVEVKTDLTPMIDVTFLLLIFFVLNIKFKSEEGEIEAFLPKNRGQGSGTPQIDLKEIRVKLLWLDSGGNPTSDNNNGNCVVKINRKTFNNPGDDLENPLTDHPVWNSVFEDIRSAKGSGDKAPPCIIDAREQVPYRYVIRALNEVVRAEIKDVTFAAPEKPY